MLPELPTELQRKIMLIRRTEDAMTIQRYWRAWRWRLWWNSKTMPFVCSWHPCLDKRLPAGGTWATFLNVQAYESHFHKEQDTGDDSLTSVIRTELIEKLDRYRSLARMAANHYGHERISAARLYDQIREPIDVPWDIADYMRVDLVKVLLALQCMPLHVIDGGHHIEYDESNLIYAVAALKGPKPPEAARGVKRRLPDDEDSI